MQAGGGTTAASRPGRPTAARAARIDAQILSSAFALFVDAGFEAVSMEAIAAAAGISKGTLYARHPSKPELLRAVMADRIAAWSQTAGADDHLLPPDLAGRLRAHAATIRTARHWHETLQMQRLAASVAEGFPQLAAEWHELAVGSFRHFLADDMARAAVDDGPGPDGTGEADWEFLADLFLHALGGWSDAEEFSNRRGDDEYGAFADKLIAIVVLAARANAAAPRFAGLQAKG